jgi:hypothetical protein
VVPFPALAKNDDDAALVAATSRQGFRTQRTRTR